MDGLDARNGCPRALFHCPLSAPHNPGWTVCQPTSAVYRGVKTDRGTAQCLLLELLVHRQRNLRRDVNESFTEQKAHRLAGVVQQLVQLFNHALLTVLLTEAQNQLFNLFRTLRALESKEKALTFTSQVEGFLPLPLDVGVSSVLTAEELPKSNYT